jgi:DtxR family Mn-dependent transcriptional regulator
MLSRKAEDYLEAILTITEEKGYARIKDIAAVMGVRSSSVTSMVQKLEGMGYVLYRKYDGVGLTDRGRDIASATRERHQAIRAFLEFIMVPPDMADRDACKMEHELSDVTTVQIKSFVKFLEDSPDSSGFMARFGEFCNKTGKGS